MVAIGGLLAAAALGVWHIGEAYLGAWLGWPRPESLKPFFETLARWTAPAEIAALRSAFAQWDIDRYGMNAALVPLLIGLTLAGGHYFVPIGHRLGRWLLSAAVLALALLCALAPPARASAVRWHRADLVRDGRDPPLARRARGERRLPPAGGFERGAPRRTRLAHAALGLPAAGRAHSCRSDRRADRGLGGYNLQLLRPANARLSR